METSQPERSRTPCDTNLKRLGHPRARYRKNLRDFSSDHNLKSPERKSSDESAVNDPDLTAEINYGDYDLHRSDEKMEKRTDFNYKIINNDGAIGEVERFQMPPAHSIVAEEKLKRLKELQRKREFTERYYSQEIRKLITEYYKSSARNCGGDSKNRELSKTSAEHNYKEVAIKPPQNCLNIFKNLEPCGTMTTITRLDCGCTQETTRPIFTTSNGRVEKRNCRHGENPALKLQASLNPQEHLSSLNFNDRNKKIIYKSFKHRSGTVIDPRIIQIRTHSGNCNDIHNPRKIDQQLNNSRCNNYLGHSKAVLRRPETASTSFIRDNPQNRNLSPLRKYSDSSTE